MTIYMVQQTFSRPDWEEEWNAWYAGNLKVLLGVPGFRTGQRFRAIDGSPSRYLAMYTVDSPAVFESPAYRDAGGGGANSQRFRPAYLVWIRNLFEGLPVLPEVRADQYLVCVDGPDRDVMIPGVALTWLEATGFHKSTAYRGIGIVGADRLAVARRETRASVYRPLSAQQGPLY